MSANECIALLTPLIQRWENANHPASRWSSAFVSTIQNTLIYLSLIERTPEETTALANLQGRANWLQQQDLIRANPLILAPAAPSTPNPAPPTGANTPPSA